MSWLYSRALVEGYSEANCSGGEPTAPSKSTHTPQAYLLRDKTTDAWSRFPSGMTCGLLTESRGAELLMLYLAGFHARTSALQEKAQGSPENDQDYGVKCGASLAKYDHDTCSWKTPQRSLFGDLEPFSVIWPRWGTMRDGECWGQLTPERRTNASESGLWPTPLKNCGTGAGLHGTGGMNIQTAVQMWPTPTVQDSKNNGSPMDAVAGGTLNPTWVEWLMGWPLGWTDLHVSAMDKFREWQRLHGKR